MVEFINQYMEDYSSRHVGKDLYREKKHEEDIVVIPKTQQDVEIPISLKAYGDGPLQLSTDKESSLFNYLESQASKDITDEGHILSIFSNGAFREFGKINVLPLIYREQKKKCCIVTFDFEKAISETSRIVKIEKGYKLDKETGNIISAKGRKHPIYVFVNSNNDYICEVRYGGKAANALQRGLWTHTQNAASYFSNLTGWIGYEHNLDLVKLLSLALNSTQEYHRKANGILQEGIESIR